MTENTPLLRFGVVADVQYADSPDKKAWYNPSKTRFYRNSLCQVEKAFQYWEKLESESNCKVSFILQLGDIIDALNTSACSQSAIHKALSCFLNNPNMPTFHTVGNHELYNFNRVELSYLFDKFLFQHFESDHQFGMRHVNRIVGEKPLFYRFMVHGIKFISLDCYDISVLGYDEEHSKYQLASQILQAHHGHTDYELWDTDQNLIGANKRYQSSNGALSEEQLKWLEEELALSDEMNEMVIVFGHVGIHPKSCGWDSILWNYDTVIELFNRHASVVAYFSGHAHNSGYACENGVHYVVLHGIIESAPEVNAFTTVTIFENQLDIDGQGVEQKLTLSLNKRFSFAIDGCHIAEDDSISEPPHIDDLHLVEIEIKV